MVVCGSVMVKVTLCLISGAMETGLPRLCARVMENAHSSLRCWIIYRYLMDNMDFRFEHFNLDVHKGIVRVTDKRRMIADVYFRRRGETPTAWCELDKSTECEHIKYALKIPEIIEALNKNGYIVKDGKIL